MGIKVRAISTGYFGDVLRKPNGPHAVFEVEKPEQLSMGWMQPADDKAVEAFKKRFGSEYRDPRRVATNPYDADKNILEEDGINENKLRNALLALDVNDDAHWTEKGFPKMAIVEKIYGSKDVNKEHVEFVLPGWNRDLARVKSGQA